MNKFDDYTRVEDGLPKENMFCDIVGVRPDGIFKEMKVFYRAKIKKEYYTDKNGNRKRKWCELGFILPKSSNGLKVIAWKEHKELSDLVKAIYGKDGAE